MGGYSGVRVTATGNVGGANGGSLIGGTLTAGADAASLVLREGGSGGTVLATIKAAAGATQPYWYGGTGYSGQLHATLTGTSPEATVVIG